MNEELLSSMTFKPEKCEPFDLGEVQKIHYESSSLKDDIENVVIIRKCNREFSCEFNLTDEGIDNLFDEIHKGMGIVLGRTPWGGALSMTYEVVKKLYPKKYKDIVIEAERNYLNGMKGE